jgi:hypothetical protein
MTNNSKAASPKASFDMPAIRVARKPCLTVGPEKAMKYVTAFLFALFVLSGPLSAETLWDQVSQTAPRSGGVFEDLKLTPAQPTECAGDYVCIDGPVLADKSSKSTNVANIASPVAVERCVGLPVHVTAGSLENLRLICAAADDTIRLLGRCGISLHRPLHVEIMNEVQRPSGGAVFGLFDTKQERVLITRESNIPELVKDTPYAGLPQRVFYRSLIVHEVVHGVMHQNLTRKATTLSAYEYPAYALQMESLPADVRDTFLRSFEQSSFDGGALFNDSILMFSPYYFAARAYHHFKSASDPCAHLTSLLADAAPFIASM